MNATHLKSKRGGSKVIRNVWNERFYPMIPIINQEGDVGFTQAFNNAMDNEAKTIWSERGHVNKIVLPMVIIIEIGMRTNTQTIFPPHVLDFTDARTKLGFQYVGPHDQSKIELRWLGMQ